MHRPAPDTLQSAVNKVFIMYQRHHSWSWSRKVRRLDLEPLRLPYIRLSDKGCSREILLVSPRFIKRLSVSTLVPTCGTTHPVSPRVSCVPAVNKLYARSHDDILMIYTISLYIYELYSSRTIYSCSYFAEHDHELSMGAWQF